MSHHGRGRTEEPIARGSIGAVCEAACTAILRRSRSSVRERFREPLNPSEYARKILAGLVRKGEAVSSSGFRAELLIGSRNEKAHREGGLFSNYAGDHLISHTLARAVPSAQRGLTSVFGMGTGGTLAVNSPANCRASRRDHSQLNRLGGFFLLVETL